MNHCERCGAEFIRATTWQAYCSRACQNQREAKGPGSHCYGCGGPLAGRQRRWCSVRCKKRGDLIGSALLRCHAPGCGRRGLLMVHRLRKAHTAFECAACGQLTPMALVTGDDPTGGPLDID